MKQNFFWNFEIYMFFVLISYIVAYSNNLKKSESNSHNHSKTRCDILMNGWLNILEGPSRFKINPGFGKSPDIQSKDVFYFRLTKNLLFYTESKVNLDVVDSIQIKEVKLSENSNFSGRCFIVKHIDNKTVWNLCAKSIDERNKWVCAIKKALGLSCDVDQTKIEIIKRRIIKQPVIIIPVASPMCNEKWNYSSHGEDWQCECLEGLAQSPIDLPDIKTIPETFNRTLFSFFETEKDENGNPFEIIFENHMLKIKGIMGSLVTWELVKYELYEVQFHTHSEHTIKNEVFDMEVQFYYRAITPGYLRKTAAVGVLFKIVPGSTNLFLDKTINILDLPDRFEKKKKLLKPLNLKHLFMLDKDDDYEGFSYYTYEGSLTSPNCQDETTWFVTTNPMPVSYTTVEYFRDILRPQTFEADLTCMKLELTLDDNIQDNTRKTQNLNNREIYYYDNHCNVIKKPRKPKPTGHFEKVDQKITNYFYVSDDKPSGIPNAFVVSPGEALGIKDTSQTFDEMNIRLMK